MSHLPKYETTLVYDNISVATKKGNNDGTTAVAHKISPFLAATRFVLEKSTKHIVKMQSKIVTKFFLSE